MSQLPRPKGIVERMRAIEAELRWQHVDIQRLWKRAPGLGEFAYLGGAFPATEIEPPFDEPPSGGTAQTGTPCKQRYCVSRYAGEVTQIVGDGGVSQWSNLSKASGPPDGVGASVALAGQRSYYLLSDSFEFTIPDDAKILEVRLHVTCRASEPSQDPAVLAQRQLHQSGTGKGLFFYPVLPIRIQHDDWIERIIGEKGVFDPISQSVINPGVVNSTGFGAWFGFLPSQSFPNVTMFVDSIRLEVCYEVFTLSGTCSENPG